MFSLKALAGQDPLPKSAAAEFWVYFNISSRLLITFINVLQSQFVSLSNLSPPLQTSIDEILAHFGPLLAEALVYNITGNAARSELDKVSDPLKKLVVRQVKSKSWLENALFRNDPQGGALKEGDKRAFLQRIIR